MGKLIFNAQSIPVAPVGENKHTMFVDSCDGKLKMEDCSGCVCEFGLVESYLGTGVDGDLHITSSCVDSDFGWAWLCAREWNLCNFIIDSGVCVYFCGAGVPIIKVQNCFCNLGTIDTYGACNNNGIYCSLFGDIPIYNEFWISTGGGAGCHGGGNGGAMGCSGDNGCGGCPGGTGTTYAGGGGGGTGGAGGNANGYCGGNGGSNGGGGGFGFCCGGYGGAGGGACNAGNGGHSYFCGGHGGDITCGCGRAGNGGNGYYGTGGTGGTGTYNQSTGWIACGGSGGAGRNGGSGGNSGTRTGGAGGSAYNSHYGLVISANNFYNNCIKANGGNGGAGGGVTCGSCCALNYLSGAGGNGSNGGTVKLFYHWLNALGNINVSQGYGGSAGVHSGGGNPGRQGHDGTPGLFTTTII